MFVEVNNIASFVHPFILSFLRCQEDACHNFFLKIAWIRYDTKTILSMHEVKVTQSDRYALEKIEGSIDLIITNVTEDDAGTYICQLNSQPTTNHVGRS